MRTNKRVEQQEIELACNFVNSFDTYDPANLSQASGFAVIEALEWARGRHVNPPSLRRLKAERKLAERKV